MLGFSNNCLTLKGLAVATVVLAFVIMTSSNIDGVSALEYPTPPPLPAKFNSRQDVQRYLDQLRNYYLVVGRPR